MAQFQTLSRRTFGPCSRYCLQHSVTRLGTDHYFILDAEREDEVTGGPAVIGQFDDAAAAEARVAALDC